MTSCGGARTADVLRRQDTRLWHYEGPDSAMGVAWNEAIKEFEATHPGVKVKFEEKGFEQIQKTAPMVLNSSDAPDLMEYNKGNATAGLLSKQGLLTDLTAEATKRGWDKKISPRRRHDQPATTPTESWAPASGTACPTTPSTRWSTTTRPSSRSTRSPNPRPSTN